MWDQRRPALTGEGSVQAAETALGVWPARGVLMRLAPQKFNGPAMGGCWNLLCQLLPVAVHGFEGHSSWA